MLTNLRVLECNDTEVSDVHPLVNLVTLYCQHTKIKDVNGLINLRKLICDDTLDKEFFENNSNIHYMIAM